MIDIHSHILPGVDDGAATQEESLQMLQLAWRQGFRQIIATPHDAPYFPYISGEAIKKEVKRLEQLAQIQIHPDIRIHAGHEIYYDNRTLDRLRAGELLPLADSRAILVEFAPDVSWSYLYTAIRNLANSPWQPIIAHVERYACLTGKMDRIWQLKEQGAKLQMNYRSLEGPWYHSRTRWCRKLIHQGVITCLGTDMHNMRERSPRVKESMTWLKKIDQEYTESLCHSYGESLINKRGN